MPFATARDGVKLHYALHDYTDPWKKPQTLILQHGYGRTSRFWFNLIPYLARFYRVLCPDLRGLGQSAKPADMKTGITVENYLSDIISVANDAGAETFHYAADSMGGILGMVLATQQAARMRTLSLLCSPLKINPDVQEIFRFGYPSREIAMRTMGAQGWSEAVNSATRFPPGTDPALMKWYADEMGKEDVDVLVRMSEINAVVDVTDLLPSVNVPVLGLYPQGGKIATHAQGDLMMAKMPDCRIVYVPNPTHMIWVTAPQPAPSTSCISWLSVTAFPAATPEPIKPKRKLP